ncbi:Rsd/AlgQ family anti-sigma factor [Vibrio splendidus]|jgi:regulator of sigma D|uniref:Anti-RNA polymerase sigma 70 factor n=1 Tax=Vibrio splendidus TaxID=29497 RepID=A0A2J6UKA4_VIBSP|nr:MULTISPECIES: Rsd/AlgQ family anti-sigma factor [Vibrio]MBO7912314.1 Rsd/AlgQ family anti-sigma factor [Vibrio sp. G41H]MBT9243267.1 Rsd/AlgQ family anti-sigma factor [Vibrio splendidus]MCF7492122.1 Rsd/AlgQ family anti-sigma factor [Vibrio sp. G-C-1]MCT4349833.1 Rsd/AlgQ family anti-sigma factor [Vibrio sp. NC2]MCW4440068.1 Rsd/AlgQ family anti-sigma factor [Vibrio splendidus]
MVMLNKFKQIQEQWGGSNEVIDHWLETRQSLIVEYCKLAALQPSSSKATAITELPSPEELQKFSQHLVDYISEGHFKIYDMVMDKWQSTGFKATDEINQSYGHIVLTTDPLLNFTDKYAAIEASDTLEGFDSELSLIGEILEARFAVEDQLIQQIADSLAVPPGA